MCWQLLLLGAVDTKHCIQIRQTVLFKSEKQVVFDQELLSIFFMQNMEVQIEIFVEVVLR